MNDPIKILIVDDHGIVRKGLRALLDGKPGLAVIGEAGNGIEAVAQAQALQPDVILLDLVMPKMDGIAAIHAIKEQNAAARILVLTSFADDDKVFKAIQAGALGYLLKATDDEKKLVQAIEMVHAGSLSLPPNIAARVFAELNNSEGRRPSKPLLTRREIQVLQLLAQGLTNQEIADELTISVRTVTTHVTNILGKLHFNNRTQAAAYAIQQGLTENNQET